MEQDVDAPNQHRTSLQKLASDVVGFDIVGERSIQPATFK